jgi:serine/threonine-protein kinase
VDVSDTLRLALGDRYSIERELGAGGMATVYLAEDLRHHRKVALKVLRPEIAATLGAERFHREIQIAAQLQHPNILPVHDSGEAAGFLYYVMPYIGASRMRSTPRVWYPRRQPRPSGTRTQPPIERAAARRFTRLRQEA